MLVCLPLCLKLTGGLQLHCQGYLNTGGGQRAAELLVQQRDVYLRAEVRCIKVGEAALTNLYDPDVILTRLIPPSTPDILMCRPASIVPLMIVMSSGLVYEDAVLVRKEATPSAGSHRGSYY